MHEVERYLTQYLEGMVLLYRLNHGADFPRHQTWEQFVLDNGVPMDAGQLPESIPQGEKKLCYPNAFELRLKLLCGRYGGVYEPGELEYCEGYARSSHGIVTLHGWLFDNVSGLVIDPTWDDPEDCAYFGVPWSNDTLRQAFELSETLPLMDHMHPYGRTLLTSED